MGLYEDTEWRAFFTAKSEFASAQRKGESGHLAIGEIEAIAMHTENALLRREAQQFLAAEEQRKAATA